MGLKSPFRTLQKPNRGKKQIEMVSREQGTNPQHQVPQEEEENNPFAVAVYTSCRRF